MRTLWVGLAKSGQRRAEGPPLGWIKFGPDFICRSQLNYTTLSEIHKATGTSAFVYINYEDHRLVEPCSRSPHFWRNGTEVTRARSEKRGGFAANPRKVGEWLERDKPVLRTPKI